MRKFKYSIIASIILSVALIACGSDSGTSANDDVEKSSSSVTQSSSSVIQSGDSHEGSSSSKRSSSSSSKVSSSSAKATSSSSSAKSVSSSSKRSEGDPSSSSQKTTSSSSVSPASSSSKKIESSSSEYVPYDHFKCLADNWNLRDTIYKQFTDPRNGRSYYYYTAVSSKTGRKVTVMAENLNIGEMVLGENNQNDDAKIERYCYNNDTTKCDEFGGLYQWAEMMQLPSRCNIESCSDLIQENHRGICPEGWRLFTWDDYEIVRGYDDKFDDGIKGLRSTYGFRGTNQSGFSLTGAGVRDENGGGCNIEGAIFWFFPEEHEYDIINYVHAGYVSSIGHAPAKDDGDVKIQGRSVRCVKLE
ncbi:MAG: hypothetical protein IJM92_19090 [Fibrobacter sp.]|uniref:FISUMP domain-containing protein n=1 Tax=Fibrobacter sp. TaxID=35828 RepID=UPI0025B9623A|nr:FISUMP domain-containing protein [Fibrobacter sp.]MBQ7081721.1 hypothetical protein [Fibrobacter sp.]